MLNTAFILAAGLGSRMRPLTAHCAKPLLHFRGERLIERHLHRLSAAGFQHVIINCSWQSQLLRQVLGDGKRYGISILYSCEDSTPLETASGIARATDLLQENAFLLINGDIWTDLDLGKIRLCANCPHIVLVDNPPHNPAGDFALIGEKVQNSGDTTLTYAGVGIINSQLVQGSASTGAKLGDSLRMAAKQSRLTGLHHQGEWYDVGTPAALV